MVVMFHLGIHLGEETVPALGRSWRLQVRLKPDPLVGSLVVTGRSCFVFRGQLVKLLLFHIARYHAIAWYPVSMRLDDYLQTTENKSLKEATTLIMTGQVLLNGQKVTKPGHPVPRDPKIEILKPKKSTNYVSRGGEKLVGAHQIFKFDIQDKIALDIGLSTGGFSDYLLQNGVKTVFGVDVSYGILDLKVREDDRMILLERTNARNLTMEQLKKAEKKSKGTETLSEKINLIVMDVSFISILKIVPALQNIVQPNADYVLLIKPQFESTKEEIGPGGIVSDETTQLKIVDRVKTQLTEMGLIFKAQCKSPIQGEKKKNQEYLVRFSN